MVEEIATEVHEIEPLARHGIQDLERGGGVAAEDRAGELREDLAISDAKHARHVLRGDLGAPVGDDLVEQAHRVAHRSSRLTSEDRDRAVVGLQLFAAEHVFQARADLLGADQLEVVALTAAEDGDGDLVDLGRREDELHVRGRLFERLQERVPRRVREHVDLVHDVDFEAIARGPEGEALLKAADLVDAVVAGAVDLLDVHVDAGGNLGARRARLAGRGGRARRSVPVLGVRAEAV